MILTIHHTFDPPQPDPRLDQVIALLQQLLKQDITMSATVSTLDSAIAALAAKVAAQTDLDVSAVTLVQGIPALIAQAVAAAQAAGATPQQLQALTDLGARLDNASAPLAAAVTANTPAASP